MQRPETITRLLVRALMSPVFPALILFIFLATALILREGLNRQYQQQIDASLQNEARALTNNLEREFMILVDAIGRMARRMEAGQYTTEALWRIDARNYLDDFGVYQAV